jgi:hypothetical protein
MKVKPGRYILNTIMKKYQANINWRAFHKTTSKLLKSWKAITTENLSIVKASKCFCFHGHSPGREYFCCYLALAPLQHSFCRQFSMRLWDVAPRIHWEGKDREAYQGRDSYPRKACMRILGVSGRNQSSVRTSAVWGEEFKRKEAMAQLHLLNPESQLLGQLE